MTRWRYSGLHQFRRTACMIAAPVALSLCVSSCETESDGDTESVLRVAVAGNFAAPQAELSRRFAESTGASVETSLGATGQLYAQIVNGAPFDVLLAADTLRPSRLEQDGLTVQGTRFTYAIGRLVVYAPTWDSVGHGKEVLRGRPISHLAIANPRTAPYGAAAIEVLQAWQMEEEFSNRTVRGENVGQAFQFVETGAAEVGILALSQVIDRGPHQYWVIPDKLHTPILQDAVCLVHGESNPLASAYLDFLRTEAATSIIGKYGYAFPEANR